MIVDSLDGYTISMVVFPDILFVEIGDRRNLYTVLAETDNMVILRVGYNYKPSLGVTLQWSRDYMRSLLRLQGRNVVIDNTGRHFFVRPQEDGTYELVPKITIPSR